MTKKRRAEGFIEPTLRQLAEHSAEQRRQADEAVVNLLADVLHVDVFDEAAARVFLNRFGPFDAERTRLALDRLCADDGCDRHISVYLDGIRHELAAGGDDE